MRGLTVVVFLAGFVWCANVDGASLEDDACEVRLRTDAGWVCGRVRDAEGAVKYASFRGVPYGKPPVGERRFQELEPLDPWDGFLDATEDSPACPQKDLLYGELTQHLKGMNEDCIYLNLHVPLDALPTTEEHMSQNNVEQSPGLPILVMIHGGGFHTGSGLTDVHGPEYLMMKNVIVITFNYRINVFGFLSLKTKQVPGNQGLRDQLTLLRWVQKNARAFGGDPGSVTLMGQSAGASCAHILSLSKSAEGLFHRLILMSGSALPNYYTASPKHAKYVADILITQLGINSTNPEEIHKQLIDLPLVNIMQAYNLVQHEVGIVTFVPVAEEEYPNVTRILDDEPLELIAKGRGKDYPLLIGFTDKEAEFFRWLCLNFDIMRRVEDNPVILLTSRLVYSQPPEKLSKLANDMTNRYFNGTRTIDNFLEHLSDKFFKQPAFKTAVWKAIAGAPAYLYQYSYKSEKSLIKKALWTAYEGGAHVEDLTYIFRTCSMLGDYVSFPAKNNDDRMKDWMTTLVTNFMKCSNPTCSKDETDWPPVSADNLQYQDIAEPMVYSMMSPTADQQDMLQFYDKLDEMYRHVTERLENTNT